MNILSKTTLALTTSVLAIGFATASSAQIQDEVIVTATKRAENIQDVPISISAYGAEFIEKSGVEDIHDIALYSPNFTIGNSSQLINTRIAIRGVGSVGNAGIEPSVGVFIDGIYYPRPGSTIGNLVDIQSFEVLRGPQGTLFGRNTPMGALNITTKDPSFSGFEAFYQAGYGNYNAYNIAAGVNIPLGENAAARITGKYSDREGYGFNLLNNEKFGDRDNLTLRGKLLFEPTDNFSIKLTADYSEINSEGTTIEYLNDTSSPVFLGNLAALAGPAATQLLTNDPTDHEVYQDHRDQSNDKQWGLAAHGEYETASGHILRSITSYRDWEAETFESAIRLPIQVFPRIQDYNNETFSQEFQILSPTGGQFDYLAGLFYYTQLTPKPENLGVR